MSEYFLDTILNVVYYQDLLEITAPFLSTGEIDFILLGQMSRHGYHSGNCTGTIKAIEKAPDIQISAKHGMHFTSKVSIDVKCTKNQNDPTFHHVFTLVSKQIDFAADASITNKTMKLDIISLKLNIDHVENSTIGSVSLTILEAAISVLEPAIRLMINLVTDSIGINLDTLLKLVGLDFISFGET